MANLASEVRVEEEGPSVRRILSSAATLIGAVGVAERGPVGRAVRATSFSEWQRTFGGLTLNNLDVVAAVQGYFDNGGEQLVFARVTHVTVVGDPTTTTSAKASLVLSTASASPTAGVATSGVQPYALDHGQTLSLKVDGGGSQVFTISATSGYFEATSAGPYALSNGQTIDLTVNGSAVPTKVFSTSEFVSIGAATAGEVVAALNAWLLTNGVAAVATVSTGRVRVTSTRKGTAANVTRTGGTATALAGSATAGTGDAANVAQMTAAEVVAKLATLTGAIAAVVSGAVVVTSSTTGDTSSVQVESSSTATGVGFDNAVHGGSDGTPTPTLTMRGKYDGTYAHEIQVVVAAATNGAADHFNLSFVRAGVTLERWPNLNFDPDSPRYVEAVVNDELTGSLYLTAEDEEAGAVQVPATGTFGPLAGGSDGLAGLTDTDYVGGESASGATGLRLLDVEEPDVVIVPGRATAATHNGMVTYCEVYRSGLCFAVLDPPASQTAEQIVEYVETTAALSELSDKAAIYWPRVLVANPNQTLFGASPTVVVAPSGHVAGVYARTDARKVGGVFEQPAGTDFGVPRNVLGLEMPEVKKKRKRDVVFPALVNPISKEKGTPIFIDGARTLKSGSAWPSVGQRRGVMFVERQLIPGLAFMRHRNIKQKLYKEGERTIETFLVDLTRNGAFKSDAPADAFFVDLGPGLNTAAVQAQRTVVARIGLATSEPAEYVILLVGPDTRAVDEELAALSA
jgi:hypothetical protein